MMVTMSGGRERGGARRRRYVSSSKLRRLRWLGFVYDYSRDGWIMVFIGRRFGPVYRDESLR
ncbi:MAG: hypothetical protein JWM47_22 [Acidimicrobiales bacterium]|nr:hypothetical protein [Acidimicrobiales bacterium]